MIRGRRPWIVAVALMLALSGCGKADPAADISQDGTIRSVSEAGYVNSLVQFSFDSELGDAFYEFYYETDGETSHVYDMDATFAIQGHMVTTSGEVWSDGETSWSTSGTGWQETAIPMSMDVGSFPVLFGYDGSVKPTRDEENYLFQWDAPLSRLAECGLTTLIGDMDGVDLSGNGTATLRMSRSDGRFVSFCINSEDPYVAFCVVLNHAGDGKPLSIPMDEITAPPADGPGTVADPAGTEDDPTESPEGYSEAITGLRDYIEAHDASLNLLELAEDHGTEYIYYETNRPNYWYAWAEIGRPEDGDAKAAFEAKKAAMETVFGEGAYSDDGTYAMYSQRSDPSTEEGLSYNGDWYVYLLAYDDEGFTLNFTIQDWTASGPDAIMRIAEGVLAHMGRDWHT